MGPMKSAKKLDESDNINDECEFRIQYEDDCQNYNDCQSRDQNSVTQVNVNIVTTRR